jgi:hypothetical protein
MVRSIYWFCWNSLLAFFRKVASGQALLEVGCFEQDRAKNFGNGCRVAK